MKKLSLVRNIILIAFFLFIPFLKMTEAEANAAAAAAGASLAALSASTTLMLSRTSRNQPLCLGDVTNSREFTKGRIFTKERIITQSFIAVIALCLFAYFLSLFMIGGFRLSQFLVSSLFIFAIFWGMILFNKFF